MAEEIARTGSARQEPGYSRNTGSGGELLHAPVGVASIDVWRFDTHRGERHQRVKGAMHVRMGGEVVGSIGLGKVFRPD